MPVHPGRGPVRAAGVVLLAGFGLGLVTALVPVLMAFTGVFTPGTDHLVTESGRQFASLVAPPLLSAFAGATLIAVVCLLLRALDRRVPPPCRADPAQGPASGRGLLPGR